MTKRSSEIPKMRALRLGYADDGVRKSRDLERLPTGSSLGKNLVAISWPMTTTGVPERHLLRRENAAALDISSRGS